MFRDADFDYLDQMWHAAGPVNRRVEEYLVRNLVDPSTFQQLKTEEERMQVLFQSYHGRSGLSAHELETARRLSVECRRIRDSLEQIRANSFTDDVEYQQLWSLREVLTICENSAARWWSDYFDELTELTGYPEQRNLPAVDEMTDEQFRDAVEWVRAHPLYKYDGSLSSD